MKFTTSPAGFTLPSAKPLLALLLSLPLAFSACSDDEPEPEEDAELITTVTYALTPAAGSTAPAATITWEDLDGAGGAAPVITGGPLTLRANTTYTGTITLLDKTKSPVANVTDEVATEKEDHLFFYAPTPAGLMTITRTDRDANNREVGLTTRLATTAAGSGSLKITLLHQPGTKDGTASTGEADVEATVPVTVQ
ncbi:hypothetical protein LJY25_17200 [Hymenobacter sp. BT175]|uniref:hypothetical protein n=1 Tax=Hymenobacter translucens TaxID=2886507 RepID=UPI001D0EE8AA|nr:hypothetical protein [Hymenobacter translucens]MCC2548190.1 hypothetical protein [Hymenobacter translucens]